ncbi:MAG: hypothetical protein Q7T54_00540 [Candidatus Levybacteria bacterium]|nr:hypothetical protein [Candidatus Levybacteria bacterium]
MDKKIEDFKKYYLQTPPPMEVGTGFAEVLRRIDNEKSTPFYFSRIFIAAILFLLVSTGVAGAVLLSPPNTTLNAVKAAAQRVVEHTFNIPENTIVLPTRSINKKAPTPTLTPTKIEKDSGFEKSEERRLENKHTDEKEEDEASTRDTDVKGVSDENKPTTNDSNEEKNDSRSNSEDDSEDHKNENAEDGKENPSSEKSSGKSKN